MPTLSEKNAWPMALSTTLPVILLKSGRSRKVSPVDDPGIVMDTATRSSRMMKSSGIMSLEYRSMPFLTPRDTTKWVSSKKRYT